MKACQIVLSKTLNTFSMLLFFYSPFHTNNNKNSCLIRLVSLSFCLFYHPVLMQNVLNKIKQTLLYIKYLKCVYILFIIFIQHTGFHYKNIVTLYICPVMGKKELSILLSGVRYSNQNTAIIIT